MKVGDWELFAHPLFLDQLEALTSAVGRTRKKDPDGYRSRRAVKMLAAVLKLAFEDIPADPAHSRFEQGETLGAARKHWRRAKFYQQHRLFFRFSSTAKVIVLAWVNDEQTRRTYGSRTDAYAVFAKMLKAGNPPDDWDALVVSAKALSERTRLAGRPPTE